MYPRHRLDGLADAIYGVAMTLLVLEIRLPEGFSPHSDQEMIAALQDLAPRFWPYVLSFAVLATRWRSMVRDRAAHAEVGRAYANWWLIHLFLITLIPFSSMVMGNYASRAPSVWIYAANLAALSIAGWRLAVLAPKEEREKVGDNLGGTIMLLASAILAVALSFRHTPYASLAFALNLFGQSLQRVLDRAKSPAAA